MQHESTDASASVVDTLPGILSLALSEQTRGWSALQIHKKLILHFCSIMFVNGHLYTSIEHVLQNAKILELQNTCILHPAIKIWICKVHQKEPHLHREAKDWLATYPTLLKAAALRFIHYHRDFANKPFRLFSTRMFCQLASEAFCCHICLDGRFWFYPLETADYFLNMDLPIVSLITRGKGTFSLSTDTVEPLLVLPTLELIKE